MRIRGAVAIVLLSTGVLALPAGTRARLAPPLLAQDSAPLLPQAPPAPAPRQQPRPPVQPPDQPSLPRRPSVQLRPSIERFAQRLAKPRVVCGMTLIPGDPTIDPGIVVKPDPRQAGNPTKYTIRPVQPTICWDPAQTMGYEPFTPGPSPPAAGEQRPPVR